MPRRATWADKLLPWSRANHCYYPRGLRQAARTLLLVNHREAWTGDGAPVHLPQGVVETLIQQLASPWLSWAGL
jgi:hypothetical protein